jgi:hypothetical protein
MAMVQETWLCDSAWDWRYEERGCGACGVAAGRGPVDAWIRCCCWMRWHCGRWQMEICCVAFAAVNHQSVLAVMGGWVAASGGLCYWFGCWSWKSVVEAPLQAIWRDCRWRGEWPAVGKSVVVGLVVIGVDAEFPIGVAARCDRLQICWVCGGCLLVEKMNSVSSFFFSEQ